MRDGTLHRLQLEPMLSACLRRAEQRDNLGEKPEGFETRGAWRKFPSDQGTRANATQVRLDAPPNLCAPSSMPKLGEVPKRLL